MVDALADARTRRRQQTREAMQRLRTRKQLHVRQLRDAVQSLEETHASLIRRIENCQFNLHGPLRWPLPSLQLEEVIGSAQVLTSANEQLRETIEDHVRWHDRVKLLVGHLHDESRDEHAMKRDDVTPLAILDYIAVPRMSTNHASELMQLHRKKHKALKRQWLLAAIAPLCSEFFGWSIQYFPNGRYWHLKFTKLFRNASARQVARRAWSNAQRLVTYRTRLPSRRLVQHINETAFVFAWWTADRDQFIRSNQLVFMLRFRVEKPDGTFGIGMLTVPEFGENHSVALDDTLLSVDDECWYIKLKPVVDEQSGAEHCVVEYSGRTEFGDAAYAQRNALEMVLSLARWEETNVATRAVCLEW